MFSEQRLVMLCDVDTLQDEETGDRKRVVVHAHKAVGEKAFVGVQTQQLGQLQNMTFQYAITIDKMYYQGQKYLWLENGLYEVKTLTPAKLPKDCKLNIVKLDDADVENAIREYLK
jgi:hypothetical protein